MKKIGANSNQNMMETEDKESKRKSEDTQENVDTRKKQKRDDFDKSSLGTGLQDDMSQKNHKRLSVKNKVPVKKELNLNQKPQLESVVSPRKEMAATTTILINRIWGQYYSNYPAEDSKKKEKNGVKEGNVEEEPEDKGEDIEEAKAEKEIVIKLFGKLVSTSKSSKPCSSREEVTWVGEVAGRTCKGEALYKQAIVRGNAISAGCSVLVETQESMEYAPIYFVEYVFEDSDSKKMGHGRLVKRGFQTVLGNTGNERELFLTHDCFEFELGRIRKPVSIEIRVLLWGHQHRKLNAAKDKIERERAKDRKTKGLPIEYFCKSLYCPDKGGFFSLVVDSMGVGSGHCTSCKQKQVQREREAFKVNSLRTGFTYKGMQYSLNDFVYISPDHFNAVENHCKTHRGGRNIGLRSYIICQLLDIVEPESPERVLPDSFRVKLRRFYRPEDVSVEITYSSDMEEVFYSEDIIKVPLIHIEGKCKVQRKQDFLSTDTPGLFEHVFFCKSSYDNDSGAIKQLPAKVKLSSPIIDEAAIRIKNGKYEEGERCNDENKNLLAALDIFAGCGGLSEGLKQSGVCNTKWAIEYENPAGEAFRHNHPEAIVLVNNCNVILRAIMAACGDADDCISTEDAIELAANLDEKEIANLPRPGQVDFINGGPPCQGFSAMNRFNQSSWSKVQCEMILAFLSFADYFRPKYFLLENVRNFVSYNKGQTFRLTIASLLEMGYQVRFGILDAGAYGVSQSRKRTFIWAAAPQEIIPEWPEPMHVFSGPELKIELDKNTKYAAVRSTSSGAAFRAITVRDTIGDLPEVKNGASATTLEYKDEPVSWFKRKIRANAEILVDHITKKMNEINLIRCMRIPKCPGADWRDLPNEEVKMSNGEVKDLIPWCLLNTAQTHNQWKGCLGRLDWEGNFLTSITDPQPLGKVGMVFHPLQDRIITVRESARSQGFPDSYKFVGDIKHKYRQIGNAVPPPLAYALGRKLKEAVEEKAKRQ